MVIRGSSYVGNSCSAINNARYNTGQARWHNKKQQGSIWHSWRARKGAYQQRLKLQQKYKQREDSGDGTGSNDADANDIVPGKGQDQVSDIQHSLLLLRMERRRRKKKRTRMVVRHLQI